MTTISRVGYCAKCARSLQPKTSTPFLAYGSTSKDYKVLECQCNGMIGYTPHLYRLKKVLGDKVLIQKSCAMLGCGVAREWKISGGSGYYYYYPLKWTEEVWTLETWNALVQLKRHHWFTKQFMV